MSLTYGVSPHPAQAAGEFEQRFLEHGALDGRRSERTENIVGERIEELLVGIFAGGTLFFECGPGESSLFRFGRAGLKADAASGAVFDIDLDLEVVSRVFLRFGLDGLEGCRSICQIFGIVSLALIAACGQDMVHMLH